MIKTIKRASVILIAVTLLACGGPSPAVLKGAVAAFVPFIAFEIQRGHITPEKAKLYTDDANALIDHFEQLTTAWATAKTKPEKATAIGDFVNQVVPIVNDFAKLPQLQTALLIFNTSLAVLQAFYSGAPQTRDSRARVPKTEKELKDYLEAQSKALKAALAH